MLSEKERNEIDRESAKLQDPRQLEPVLRKILSSKLGQPPHGRLSARSLTSCIESIIRVLYDDKSKKCQYDPSWPKTSAYVDHFLTRSNSIKKRWNQISIEISFALIEISIRALVLSGLNRHGKVSNKHDRHKFIVRCIEIVEEVQVEKGSLGEMWQEIIKAIHRTPTWNHGDETQRTLACAVVWCGLVIHGGKATDNYLSEWLLEPNRHRSGFNQLTKAGLKRLSEWLLEPNRHRSGFNQLTKAGLQKSGYKQLKQDGLQSLYRNFCQTYPNSGASSGLTSNSNGQNNQDSNKPVEIATFRTGRVCDSSKKIDLDEPVELSDHTVVQVILTPLLDPEPPITSEVKHRGET